MRRRALAPLLTGLAILLAAGSAAAQPLRLTPNAPPSDKPAEATPAPPQGSAPSQGSTPPQGNVPPAAVQTEKPAEKPADPDGVVRVEALKAPDPSNAGLIADDAGGLGGAMWTGTSRSQSERVIRLLPAPVSSPGPRSLQRRLLLTTAVAPEGAGGTPSLLGLRIAQLYRIGATAEALQLASPKPAALKDPIFQQLPVEQALLRHDLDTACRLGAQALREDPAAPWQKVAVLCRYRAKDVAGGDLALSLWRDQADGDPAFIALAAALRGDARAKVESLGGASALHLAMLREAKRPLPKDVAETAPAALLPALADFPGLEAEQKLSLLERAAALGAIAPADLAAAYGAIEIAEAQRPALAAGREKSPRAAAYLFQLATSLPPGDARAEAARRAYELALARDLLQVTAQIWRDILRDLPPSRESARAADAVIRLALAAGETGTARLWRNYLLGLSPETEREAADAATRAWPLMLLAEAGQSWRDSQLEAWSALQKDLPPAQLAARQALLLVLAEAAGITVPAERWQLLAMPGLAADRPAPPVAVWRNLLRAAEANAKAETVALALALLGPDGLEQADAASLATALGALRRVGLAEESRALALEAALLRGF